MGKQNRTRTYLVSSGRTVLRLAESRAGGFIVTSPHDPELVTQAETIAQAFENAADAARTLRGARVKSQRRDRPSRMKVEYRLDYRKSRPNRFATRMRGNRRAVVLDSDLASVFRTSKSLNDFLRSVISALPRGLRTRPVRPSRIS